MKTKNIVHNAARYMAFGIVPTALYDGATAFLAHQRAKKAGKDDRAKGRDTGEKKANVA